MLVCIHRWEAQIVLALKNMNFLRSKDVIIRVSSLCTKDNIMVSSATRLL